MPKSIIGGTFRYRPRTKGVERAVGIGEEGITPICWSLNSIASVGLHLNHLFSAIWLDISQNFRCVLPSEEERNST